MSRRIHWERAAILEYCQEKYHLKTRICGGFSTSRRGHRITLLSANRRTSLCSGLGSSITHCDCLIYTWLIRAGLGADQHLRALQTFVTTGRYYRLVPMQLRTLADGYSKGIDEFVNCCGF
jgi:hypothetical protein